MTPNRPGTPTTTFRLDPALIAAAKVKAAERGETVTCAVRRALREYTGEESGLRDAVRALLAAYDNAAPDWWPAEIDTLREYVEEEK